MLKDIYGNAVSTTSRAALAKFDEALKQIRLYHGDPIGSLDAALGHDPEFSLAWAARAALLAQQTDALYADEVARSLREARAGRMNDREREHLAGAIALAEGRLVESGFIFARIAQEHPRDLLALQIAHIGCFFTGQQNEMRDWPLQALRAWRRGEEGHHAILGMAAFGLEECGDYGRAQAFGTEAVDTEPEDAWAVHAVAHVHEMRGDIDAGVKWLEATAHGWGDCGLGVHNWWHLALLKLDAQDVKGVLALYDQKVRPNDEGPVLMEMLDASAMLWRLHLDGVNVGDRFERLAKAWERTADDGHYAFNNLHAAMAFLGAERQADVARTLNALRREAAGDGDSAYMARAVGLPATEGFAAYSAGRFGEAVEKIASVRGVAQRFGGSHAQRDILSLTALQAAIRGGMKETARALAAERLSHKPQSPWAGRLMRQASNAGAARAAE